MGEIIETGYKATNIVNYTTWITGTTGDQVGFNAYGLDEENYIIDANDPMGKLVPIWEARPDGGSATVNSGDGGFDTDIEEIDNTKMYRYSCWFKDNTTVTSNLHFGVRTYDSSIVLESTFNRVDGLGNSNPFFYSSAPPSLDENWYLFVGHLWPVDSGTGGIHPETGFYSIDGTQVTTNMRDYVTLPDTTYAKLRSYLWDNGNNTGRRQYVYPRIDIVDGTEPSVQDLIAGYDSRTFDLQDSLDGLPPKNPLIINETVNVNLISEIGITDSLVGYWSLDGNTADLSGSGFTSEERNETGITTLTYSDGVKGSACVFDSSINNHILTNFINRQGQSYTISAWFYNTEGATGTGQIIGSNPGNKTSVGYSGFGFYIDRGDLVVDSIQSVVPRNALTPIDTGEVWQHGTGIFDFENKEIKVYLNGELKATTTGWNGLYFSEVVCRIGTDDPTVAEFAFGGKLAEIRVYERVLSDEEIMIDHEFITEKKLKMTNSTIYSRGIIEG